MPTNEELQENYETFDQIRGKINNMMEYIKIALAEKVGTIDLTTTQITAIKARYATEKEEMETLYRTLH